MDAITAPSRDLVSGDQAILTSTFYATIDEQARRRGKPAPSDDLTGLLNPMVVDPYADHPRPDWRGGGGAAFIPQPSFANQVAGSILDAGLRALRDHHEGISRFVTVSAPTGSSKSSFAWCLVASLVKTYPDISIVFACETMQQCEETYWGIHEAIEIVESLAASNSQRTYRENHAATTVPFKATKDQLVVWTGGHDRSVPLETIRDRVDNFTPTERTRRFHREDMLSARVVVCTHAKVASNPEQVTYKGQPSVGASNSQRVHWENHAATGARPRTLTIFDEQAHQVKVFETSLPKMVEAEEIVGRFAGNSAAIAVGQLRKDMEAVWSSSVQESRLDNLVIPSTFDTHWFQSEQAEGLLKGASDDDVLANVIGFARSLSVGHAFVSKEQGDGRDGVFIGYGLKFKPAPGSLLLDATADIDGIKQIVPESRTAIDVPAINFANLKVHHIETPKELMKGSKGSTQRVVKNAKTARPYAEWIKATITANTSPGEFALAVVHKTLLDHDYLPKAGIKTDDGRHIAFVNWGIGIGSNAWKDATAVFLFGEHYPRRLPTLAGVLGLTGAGGEKAQEYLASVNGLNTGEVNYKALQLGHLERWEKQMALRGTELVPIL